MDRHDADRFIRGSSPWGAAQRDTPWLDVHGDGYWIRCYRVGRDLFEWFLAFRSGESYETTQPAFSRNEEMAGSGGFPDPITSAFADIENTIPRLRHSESAVEIETGIGTLDFQRDPCESRETDTLHFPRATPASTDDKRIPHVLRLVQNSRPARKKIPFLRRKPANPFAGSEPWLDFEIDGMLLTSWLKLRDAENEKPLDSCQTSLRACHGEDAIRQLDCLAGIRPHELGRDPWLLGCPCGDPGCGGLTVRISRTEGRVRWSDFAYSWCYGDDDYFGSYLPAAGEFVFDAAQYDAELADARNRLP